MKNRFDQNFLTIIHNKTLYCIILSNTISISRLKDWINYSSCKTENFQNIFNTKERKTNIKKYAEFPITYTEILIINVKRCFFIPPMGHTNNRVITLELTTKSRTNRSMGKSNGYPIRGYRKRVVTWTRKQTEQKWRLTRTNARMRVTIDADTRTKIVTG